MPVLSHASFVFFEFVAELLPGFEYTPVLLDELKERYVMFLPISHIIKGAVWHNLNVPNYPSTLNDDRFCLTYKRETRN